MKGAIAVSVLGLPAVALLAVWLGSFCGQLDVAVSFGVGALGGSLVYSLAYRLFCRARGLR